ncbi:hypothetical protein HOG21_04770 [bacterium]|nr:hypothetical protein [bacterium]
MIPSSSASKLLYLLLSNSHPANTNHSLFSEYLHIIQPTAYDINCLTISSF